jgi:hypothetical protein
MNSTLRTGRWLLSWYSAIFQIVINRALTVVSVASTPSRLRANGALILALASCSCAWGPLEGVLVPAAESAEGGSRVPVLIATTRQKSISDPGEMFNTPHRFSLVRARRRHTGRTARVGKLKLNDQVLFAMGYNGRGVALARLLGHMLAISAPGRGVSSARSPVRSNRFRFTLSASRPNRPL